MNLSKESKDNKKYITLPLNDYTLQEIQKANYFLIKEKMNRDKCEIGIEYIEFINEVNLGNKNSILEAKCTALDFTIDKLQDMGVS